MKTLHLFNAVIARETHSDQRPYISDEGYVIEPTALWAKNTILTFYNTQKLNGNDLNKSFHKSWAIIKNSTKEELYKDQIWHYISTYGSNFKDEIYIPNEVTEISELKLTFKVIRALPSTTIQEKCLSLLTSGLALKEDTVDDIISILIDEIGYTFTGKEGIKNKEAISKIADLYGIYPESATEFLRYIIYRATGTTLLIKNDELISLIKESSYNPATAFTDFGQEKLAEIFNRFKPLFLAFKGKAPKTINKISKLSKIHHKPLVSNPLNNVTNTPLMGSDLHWLDNATPYALFKALSACYNRKNGQDAFVYSIRNGTSWTSSKKTVPALNAYNYQFLMRYLKQRFDLSGTKFYLPKDVKYGLPTSEKMFVGNIPMGTRFYGKKLAVGIYWKNDWGAQDLDLSGLNIGGKVGWNASYNQNDGSLMYSGDITNAPNGAVEYLYANKGLTEPTLIKNNVYYGEATADYQIIIGKGRDISKSYMMDPNKVFAAIKCTSVQKQTILGILIPKEDKQCFVLLNVGAGHSQVSGNSDVATLATKALYQQWNKPVSLNTILKDLGAQFVDDTSEADYDYSLDKLTKESFLKPFL